MNCVQRMRVVVVEVDMEKIKYQNMRWFSKASFNVKIIEFIQKHIFSFPGNSCFGDCFRRILMIKV